jgi:hypothetical protein
MKTLSKRLTLLILVVITVFRGMASNAMAMNMDSPSPATSQSQTLHIQAAIATKDAVEKLMDARANIEFDVAKVDSSAARPNCHGQDDAVQIEAAAPTKCTACQACHMASFVPSIAQPELANFTGEAPAERVTQWHSADRAASFKPPVF